VAFPLTGQQRQVVEDRGGGLLVSAAAGSGKTRVLVERLLSRVTEEAADIDHFLVITFTKAAAAELRARIAQELSGRLAQDPGNRHLRRQTTLVYRAQISTIHSFCAALLRESGHLVDVPADFRLCDEGEAAVLMARVLGEVLDGCYEQMEEESDFAVLVDTLSAGRDDSRLQQIVLDVFGRIQSHPDPVIWLKGQRELWSFQGISDAGETAWGRLLLREAGKEGAYCLEKLSHALHLLSGDPVLEQNYGPSIQETMEALRGMIAASEAGWDAMCSALPIPFPAAGRKRGTEDLAAAEQTKSIRARCKKQLDKLAETFGCDSGEVLEDLCHTAPAVRGLCDLVALFSQRYAAEKRRRSILDFSDLEHFAVQLLTDETGTPTAQAALCSQQFVEVMVDEYQDTNQVQNAIFTAISDGGRKLFMVGDVKQSIYRFRLADPTIFLEKYRHFSAAGEAKRGEERKIVLSKNFRSRAQVLEACNDLFGSIMTAELGELDYTDDQALVPGADFSTGEGYDTELAVLDLSCLKEEEGERQNKDLLEARWAARRISQMVRQRLLVSVGEERRPLEPSDVMVLLRSPGTVLHHYIRAFGETGIHWSADGGGDFFESTEIQVALSLLRLVDNPRQDVALISALRSPVYGFSADQLAFLRKKSSGDFYSTVVAAAQEGDTECQVFLEELSRLRFGAGDRTARQMIWHIYEVTNLMGLFGAMDEGETRQGNLLSLYALAGQMEDAGCLSLFQFLLRLDRQREAGKLFSAVQPGREGSGVSIMSIHRSKGLEKPVVLVCGLSRRLNRDDLQRPVLFHPALGVGPKGLDRERMVEFPTLARQAVARQLEQEMLSEEMRLLYVAMTRAREKLILSISLTEGKRALERLGEDLTIPPSSMALRQQSNVGSWVLLHALARPEGKELREAAGLAFPGVQEIRGRWEIQFVEGFPLMSPSRSEGEEVETGEPEIRLPELAQMLRWRYPYLPLAQIPSKLTATQMKGRPLDQEVVEAAEWIKEKELPIYRPDFIAQGRGLTAAQRGTALHLAMQYLPRDTPAEYIKIKQELLRLIAEGYLTQQQGDAVDPRRICAFLASPLGGRAAAARQCSREFKFSLLTPASKFYPAASPEESVLLQGVIDCWFEEDGGIVVIDFKSDRVTEETIAGRREAHRPQLEMYSQALEEILGKPVQERYLWFFAADRGVML